ncbi:hypothetical protein Dimus_026124 [Dionaea muscipula]
MDMDPMIISAGPLAQNAKRRGEEEEEEEEIFQIALQYVKAMYNMNCEITPGSNEIDLPLIQHHFISIHIKGNNGLGNPFHIWKSGQCVLLSNRQPTHYLSDLL